ncbi:MAG: radical SAM protein [Nitrospinae bacterium]|nr:radical SAM protein [Nitrospinota bacterium]
MIKDLFTIFKRMLGHSRLLMKKPHLIFKVGWGYFSTLILRRPTLRTIEFSVNTDCQSECEFCYSTQNVSDSEDELSLEEIRRIWQEAKKLGAFSSIISGGEPTLRKDLVEVLEAVEAKDHIVCMTTNAIALNESRLEKLKEAGLSTIHFSLDSLDPDENDKIRGYKGHYAHVIRCIQWAKNLDYNIAISTVAGHGDKKKIEKMIEFCKERKVALVLSLASAMGEWAGQLENNVTTEEWNMYNKMMADNSFMRSDWNINMSLKNECPGGREKLGVSAYGDIATCPMNPVSYGNLRKNSLKDIREKMMLSSEIAQRSPNCLIGSDHKYIKEFMEPIANYKEFPVLVDEHPVYTGKLDPDRMKAKGETTPSLKERMFARYESE